MSNVIPFPVPQVMDVTAQVMDVTDWPIQHIRQYCKDNGWKGFTMRRHGQGRLEIERTY